MQCYTMCSLGLCNCLHMCLKIKFNNKNITYKDRRTNIWVREDKTHRYNLHCEKNEMVLGRAYQPPQRRPMDLARHHLEAIMTRKDVKRDQPSGGETTWTNTGATRYGRRQHKTVIWRRHAEAFVQPRDTTAA